MESPKKLFVNAASTQKIFNAKLPDSTNVFLKSTCGNVLNINDSTMKTFNLSTSDIIGKNDYELFPTKASVKIMENDQNILKQNQLQFLIEQSSVSDTKPEMFLSIKIPVQDLSNNIAGVMGVAFPLAKTDMVTITNAINSLEIFPSIPLIMPQAYITKKYKKFSKRETECAYYLVRGMTYKEIGNILNISTKTVEYNIDNMKTKLDCYKKSQLVSKILEEYFPGDAE